jgi:hypothetical protein
MHESKINKSPNFKWRKTFQKKTPNHSHQLFNENMDQPVQLSQPPETNGGPLEKSLTAHKQQFQQL